MSPLSISAPDRRKLKKALEKLYERYDWKRYVDPDPLVFLYDYPDVRDREIAGLIASSLAFGGVKQIMASVEKVLSPMGRSPREFVTNTSGKRMANGRSTMPLYYQYYLNNIETVPDLSQNSPKRQRFAKMWKKLPIPIANTLGPKIRIGYP